MEQYAEAGGTLRIVDRRIGRILPISRKVPVAISVSPGVWLYQLTDDGVALELTAKGTKYYMDKDLN